MLSKHAKNWPKTFIILPMWQNFAKSGHTEYRWSNWPRYVGTWLLLYLPQTSWAMWYKNHALGLVTYCCGCKTACSWHDWVRADDHWWPQKNPLGLKNLKWICYFFKVGHSRPLFIYFCLFNTVDNKQMFNKIFPKTRVEPRTSGIESNCSTNWATTTSQNLLFFIMFNDLLDVTSRRQLIKPSNVVIVICENPIHNHFCHTVAWRLLSPPGRSSILVNFFCSLSRQ